MDFARCRSSPLRGAELQCRLSAAAASGRCAYSCSYDWHGLRRPCAGDRIGTVDLVCRVPALRRVCLQVGSRRQYGVAGPKLQSLRWHAWDEHRCVCFIAAAASKSTSSSIARPPGAPPFAQEAYVLPAAERSLLTYRWAVRLMFKKSSHLAFV